VTAINPKVRIGRQEDGVRQRLGHPNERGVGKAGRHIAVLPDEFQYSVEIATQIERDDHGFPPEKRLEWSHATPSQEMKRFRQRSLAGSPWWWETPGLDTRPVMVRIAATQQRDDESGVNENVSGHSRSPSGGASFAR
jgi:hypothetical protein